MKKLAMLLVLGGLAISANAAVLFEDNFESYTQGFEPNSPAVGTWDIIKDGLPGTALVSNTNAAVGNQSLAITANNNRPYCHGIFSEVTTSDIDFTVYFYANGTTANNGRIGLRNGANDKWSVFILLGEVAGGGAGNISAKNASGSFSPIGSTKYVANTWNRLDITTNLAAGTYDVSLNGTLLGMAYNYHAGITDIGRLNVSPSSYQSTAFDDIKVSTVPEPATMALMGLGAFAAIARRNK